MNFITLIVIILTFLSQISMCLPWVNRDYYDDRPSNNFFSPRNLLNVDSIIYWEITDEGTGVRSRVNDATTQETSYRKGHMGTKSRGRSSRGSVSKSHKRNSEQF